MCITKLLCCTAEINEDIVNQLYWMKTKEKKTSLFSFSGKARRFWGSVSMKNLRDERSFASHWEMGYDSLVSHQNRCVPSVAPGSLPVSGSTLSVNPTRYQPHDDSSQEEVLLWQLSSCPWQILCSPPSSSPCISLWALVIHIVRFIFIHFLHQDCSPLSDSLFRSLSLCLVQPWHLVDAQLMLAGMI